MTFPGTAKREGFSLIEILVGITILALTLLGLAGASASALGQITRSREDVRYYADVQQEIDSLMSVGYATVASGSANVRGRAISWTISTPTASSKCLTIIAQRHKYQNLGQTVQDTLLIYLSKSTPGS
jgi:prepilin-type N-terminal cleavage/methylation domain-containing protein